MNEGEKLDQFLDERADVPKALPRQAANLRAKAIGTLNRFRKDLKKEIAQNSSLPRDLEQKVFGMFDTLHAMEAAGKGDEPVEGENSGPPATP